MSLLTDFGAASPYPAEMRAVLRARCRATLVDITHDVPAHDVAFGAHMLATAAPAFPAGTVHLAVVDPGVGTVRRPLVVTAGGHVFVGPDNGLLMVAARALGSPAVFVLDVDRFARRPLSATFHGRDLFAPAAAAIAEGLPPARTGTPLATPVELEVKPAEQAAGVVRGRVLYCDAFGNAVTNIPGTWLRALPGTVRLHGPAGDVLVRQVRAYGEGRPGEPLVLVGSSGTLEIAINTARAADVLGLTAGQEITIAAAHDAAMGGRAHDEGK
ncbi:MAG: SAM-dependent chlorinase/fluorinase [Armatimonadota bacterium]|nr:SAM-dependent chlorinase/fluorinase [Armatimonadota bacterium]